MAKTDTLLAHCITRGLLAVVRADEAAGRDPDTPATLREKLRATVKATHAGSNVAALIVLWAMAQLDLERDELGTEEFAEWAAESRRTVYRRLKEFRELWPEYDTPNELAAQLVKASHRRPSATTVLPVTA